MAEATPPIRGRRPKKAIRDSVAVCSVVKGQFSSIWVRLWCLQTTWRKVELTDARTGQVTTAAEEVERLLTQLFPLMHKFHHLTNAVRAEAGMKALDPPDIIKRIDDMVENGTRVLMEVKTP